VTHGLFIDQGEIVVPTALCESIGVAMREAVHCLPPRAVRGHQHRGLEIVEGGDRWLDDRLEHRTAEVEASDDGGVAEPEPVAQTSPEPPPRHLTSV